MALASRALRALQAGRIGAGESTSPTAARVRISRPPTRDTAVLPVRRSIAGTPRYSFYCSRSRDWHPVERETRPGAHSSCRMGPSRFISRTGKTLRVAAHAIDLASRQPPAIAHVEPLERPVAYWLSWSPAAQ